jgi:hypothetical protein
MAQIYWLFLLSCGNFLVIYDNIGRINVKPYFETSDGLMSMLI